MRPWEVIGTYPLRSVTGTDLTLRSAAHLVLSAVLLFVSLAQKFEGLGPILVLGFFILA